MIALHAKLINMILHQYNSSTYLDSMIQEFWLTFKDDIIKLTRRSWKEEDYTGKSYAQWKVMKYYSALSLVTLLYLDVQKNISIYPDWEHYNIKYKLDHFRKCLACDNIDLDKILNIFSFPFTLCGDGIGCMSIEKTFIIAGEECIGRCIRVLEDGIVRETEEGSIRTLENCN